MALSATVVQWKRSEEGYAESKCRRFEIMPVYMGHDTAQAFHLFYSEHPDIPRVKILSYANTQRECKEYAQSYLVWGKK